MDLTDGSETSAKHNMTLGKYPKELIQKYFEFKGPNIMPKGPHLLPYKGINDVTQF
jgi:hypothetical protein